MAICSIFVYLLCNDWRFWLVLWSSKPSFNYFSIHVTLTPNTSRERCILIFNFNETFFSIAFWKWLRLSLLEHYWDNSVFLSHFLPLLHPPHQKRKKKRSQQEIAFHLPSTNVPGFKPECILGWCVFFWFYLENLHIFIMHVP